MNQKSITNSYLYYMLKTINYFFPDVFTFLLSQKWLLSLTCYCYIN